MDQFTYAERATDWRGNNNIAESIYQQLRLERYPGTRLDRRHRRDRRHLGDHRPLCALHAARHPDLRARPGELLFLRRLDHRNDPDASSDCGSRIEGIGRPRMEPSFVPGAIDRMMKVPDAASVAAVRALERAIGRKAGGSTGTGLWSAFKLIAEMVEQGERGSVVTLLCDPGDRYLDKYYSDSWLEEQGLDIAPYTAAIDGFLATGTLTD